MISKVAIRDYQSLKAVDLDLGKFTVIVGPSNSGKSAFVRAFKTLAYNAKSTSFVTTGESTAGIAITKDQIEVALSRGKGSAVYRIDNEEYPKAGLTVPDEVSQFLKWPQFDGYSLNFAPQFDKPFMLDETGTKVAGVLGELTNVNILTEAVREANRRRLEVGRTLKVRQGDFERLKFELEEYADLPERESRYTLWQTAYSRVEEQERHVEALGELITWVGTAVRAKKDLEERIEAFQAIEFTSVNEKADRLLKLKDLIENVVWAIEDKKKLTDEVGSLASELVSTDLEYHDVLVEAGICPVCGQEIK